MKIKFYFQLNFLATQPLLVTLQKDFHKMPPNYDFSHKSVNWKDYQKDFILRTDSVWKKNYQMIGLDCVQRQNLSNKQFFYFDSIANKYSLMEHDDCHTILFEGCKTLNLNSYLGALEDCLFSFRGTNPTGRTNCFQVGLSPKQKVYMPYPTYQSQQAYFLYVLLDFRNGLIAIKLNISKWIKQRQIISRMICLISLQNQHTLEDQTEHLNIITFSMKCVDLLLKTQKEFKKTY